MKRLSFSVCVVATALVISAGFAVARSADAPAPVDFETLDSNNDGQITQDEMASQRAAHMSRADANSDGILSAEELEAHASQRASKQVEKMLKRFDSNDDGQLSMQELAENQRVPRHFRRADRDGDGALSRAEFDAAQNRMAKRRAKAD